MRTIILAILGLLAACSQQQPGALPSSEPAPVQPPTPAPPPAPTSAEAAAGVVRKYFTLLETQQYSLAWRYWADNGRASGSSEQAFADSFGKYAELRATVGAPGRIEGAAGSLYVEVPVSLRGLLRDGNRFEQPGVVTLRRVNDVPGSTAEQRRWHIARIATPPQPH